ncbi:MAG TPA: hypothetical protein VND93_17330 [Myxococcales bacterium]|nr:hypothetical protein [Myxococcales bacterium]
MRSRALRSFRAALVSGALLAASGCAHPGQGLTVEEHQAEVARHQQAALDEEKRYDPGATPVSEGRGPFTDGTTGSVVLENPTVHHLRQADSHLRAATEHSAAARVLEASEQSACAGLNQAERDACPLWPALVREAAQTPRGVRLSLKSGVDGVALAAGMKCHLAHGHAHGWTGGCPLVVPGASVVLVDAGTLEIRGDSPASVAAVQAEARELFGPRRPPPAPVPVSVR